ncbi:MBL fold metallo-hydrolase [Dethiobacter alkaliphilus]|uniref:MBL fold metallo-hydrolase n=1 Tax=Dethiobacter alkaliphilus TaxID=427926 RepID=UPI002227DB9C|nr:MBL fold metallo-hydrolase [Dethiobacter alkaliphilus]MCW3490225.1 MBL fold metallo-hydrolase [Dethiobacter alkaliphilus]
MKRKFIFVVAVALLLFSFGGNYYLSSADTIADIYEYFASEKDSIDSPLLSKTIVSDKPDIEYFPSGKLKVHFIDVGQGDAIYIETPSKKILIDGGDRGNTVFDYLKELGVKSLDLVIGTHPHADHIGGLINVFQSIPVREVIDPAFIHTTKTFEDYLTLIDEKKIKFTVGRAGMVRDFGDGVSMSIVHPSSVDRMSANDASIVVRMTFGQISFMFTGDVERIGEEQILRSGYDLKSTVLKVGHHGSNTSTTASFLEVVSPQVAVIMVGDNKYGHPHQEVLDRLSNAKVDIYRTDVHGIIVITTNGQTFEINNKQPYQFNPPKIPEPPGRVERQDGRININTAGVEELQGIIHIGPVRAEEIIKLRPFDSVDDLVRVSGIGPVRLEDIKKEGKAYVD